MQHTTNHGAQTMSAKANQKPKLTADAAYENAHLVAQDLVERIRELLFEMPAPGNEERPIHWGHVGDVNEINRRLSEVVWFLGGTER
jgi:hypothetical protein